MAKRPGIYKITNLVNLKCYIGKSERCVHRRWIKHKSLLKNNKHHNCYLQSAWNKYGEENFAFEVIEYFDPEFNFDIDKLERFWIEDYKSNEREFGYNLTEGGEGCPASEETRAKLSAALKGKTKVKRSEEHIAKLSAANKGKKRSEETRAKMSASQLGRTHNEESKAKMSAAKKGKKFSDEHRAMLSAAKNTQTAKQRISELKKGNTFWKGRTHSAESKAKMSEKARIQMSDIAMREKIASAKFKPIYCITNETFYCSIKAAAKHLGIRRETISSALTGRRKLRKFQFIYASGL